MSSNTKKWIFINGHKLDANEIARVSIDNSYATEFCHAHGPRLVIHLPSERDRFFGERRITAMFEDQDAITAVRELERVGFYDKREAWDTYRRIDADMEKHKEAMKEIERSR